MAKDPEASAFLFFLDGRPVGESSLLVYLPLSAVAPGKVELGGFTMNLDLVTTPDAPVGVLWQEKKRSTEQRGHSGGVRPPQRRHPPFVESWHEP